jgi:protein O-GlcNAcase / histone acetyltransferase
MAELRMTAYMYAPKDEVKHRALWRVPYTASELEQLRVLIQDAAQHGVDFIFALSPGLDITYSCEADLEAAEQKLAQLMELGCRSFAICFDDVPPVLPAEDANTFASLADAQAHVTNRLLRPAFALQRALMCPTEYCGSRAMPSVATSPYLAVLGRQLQRHIDVLWTGPCVIPVSIPVASILEVTRALTRKPVLWDNLHANDYDRR